MFAWNLVAPVIHYFFVVQALRFLCLTAAAQAQLIHLLLNIVVGERYVLDRVAALKMKLLIHRLFPGGK